MIKCTLQYFLEIKSNFGFRGEGKTGVPGGNLLEQSREPTNSAYICHDAEPGNRTWGTLVGGEWSNHYTIPAPQGEM